MRDQKLRLYNQISELNLTFGKGINELSNMLFTTKLAFRTKYTYLCR